MSIVNHIVLIYGWACLAITVAVFVLYRVAQRVKRKAIANGSPWPAHARSGQRRIIGRRDAKPDPEWGSDPHDANH